MSGDQGTGQDESERRIREGEFSRRALLRAGAALPVVLSLGVVAAACGDDHTDAAKGVHGDHTDAEHGDHADSAHTDAGRGTGHTDAAHTDTAHTDSSGGHNDSGSAPHNDTHSDTHTDTHTDGGTAPPHSDGGGGHSDKSGGAGPARQHTDIPHEDVAHGDFHGDQEHYDGAPHVDNEGSFPFYFHGDERHADIPHTDIPHGDTPHIDTPFSDSTVAGR